MKYMVENPLRYFEAWNGGLRVLHELEAHQDAYDYIESWLEEYPLCGDMLTNVEVNDFLWFDALDMCEEAGYYNDETGLWYDEEGFSPVEED